MKRRSFVKALPALPVLTGVAMTQNAAAQGAAGNATPQAAAAGSKKLPAIAGKLAEKGAPHSDMTATGPDGKPQAGFAHTSSKPPAG